MVSPELSNDNEKKKNSGLIFDAVPGLIKETFVVIEPGNHLLPTHNSFVTS